MGSGAHLRFFSNTRAFVDLGYQVNVVRVAETPAPPPSWTGPRWLPVSVERDPVTWWSRISYRLGRTSPAALRFYFTKHDTLGMCWF